MYCVLSAGQFLYPDWDILLLFGVSDNVFVGVVCCPVCCVGDF